MNTSSVKARARAIAGGVFGPGAGGVPIEYKVVRAFDPESRLVYEFPDDRVLRG